MLRSRKSLVFFAVLALLTVSIGVSPDTPEATASTLAVVGCVECARRPIGQ